MHGTTGMIRKGHAIDGTFPPSSLVDMKILQPLVQRSLFEILVIAIHVPYQTLEISQTRMARRAFDSASRGKKKLERVNVVKHWGYDRTRQQLPRIYCL